MPVSKRENGNWLLSFYWPDGTRFRKTFKASLYTKRELQALERRYFQEGKKQSRGHRWSELAARYWQEHAAHLRWARIVRLHLDRLSDAIGDRTKLDAISTDYVAEMFGLWRGDLAGATLNRRMAVMRGAWRMATDVWGWQLPAIAWHRLRFKETGKLERAISQEEQQRLLDACPAYLRDIVEFALRTGLRRGAITALTWDDVERKSGIIMAIGKGQKPNPVPITTAVARILDRLPRSARSAHLFNKNGKHAPHFQKAWQAARLAAGMPTLRFHDLRHTYAQRMLDAVGDLSVVQHALHHTTAEMTERYAKRRLQQIKQAQEMMELQEFGHNPDTIANLSILTH